MRAFQQRNPIPIALAGIVAIVLGLIAALNSDQLPLVGSGTTYTADFKEAAGLRPADEVRVAGVKVGKVSEIGLVGDKVRVSFQAKDAWLGNRTSAAIKIKTVLGQKYLSLDPQGDPDSVLDPSDTIPVQRTLSPYDVLDAFQGLSKTIGSIDTQQLAKSFDTIASTFAGTPQDVRGALNGLGRLSDTIAKRDSQLAKLLANTKQVSQTLADRDAEVSRLLQDGNKVLEEVQQRKQAISTLLTGTQELSRQLQGLISDNDGQLGPVLAQLNQLTGMLQRNQDALGNGLREFAPFIRVFTNTVGNGRWFDNYICGLLLPGVVPGLNQHGCDLR